MQANMRNNKNSNKMKLIKYIAMNMAVFLLLINNIDCKVLSQLYGNQQSANQT